jgi:hypothetical protein
LSLGLVAQRNQYGPVMKTKLEGLTIGQLELHQEVLCFSISPRRRLAQASKSIIAIVLNDTDLCNLSHAGRAKPRRNRSCLRTVFAHVLILFGSALAKR